MILKGSAIYLNLQGSLAENTVNYLMLNLPYRCNYQCQKCCNRFRDYRPGNLSLATIKKAILQAKSLGVKVLVIAGEGEPTLDKNFPALVRFAHLNNLIPYIFTNGSLIDDKLAHFLSVNQASLIINIDSLVAEKYDQYVGVKGAFGKLMQNFSHLPRCYQKNLLRCGKNTITSLAVNLVLNNDNLDQISSIKKFCGNDIAFVINEPINIGSANKSWESQYGEVRGIKIEKSVSAPLGTLGDGRECSYLRNGLSVGSNGRILTCAYALETESLYGSIDADFGNLQKKVLRSVDEFYTQFGKSRCILRHPNYQQFINDNSK